MIYKVQATLTFALLNAYAMELELTKKPLKLKFI